MSQSIIIESQYFPPISSISAMYHAEGIIIEAQETYQKRSFRNRCCLIGPNGITQSSVPLVKGKHEQKRMDQVNISYDESWHQSFLRLIQSQYGRSPYFDYIYEVIERMLTQKVNQLFDLNNQILLWILEFLEIETDLSYSDVYQKEYIGDQCLDLRSSITKKNYQTYENKEYPQMFEERHGFINNVSILDLLFCLGKEAVYYL